MGATSFMQTQKGLDLKQAYRDAVENALHFYGHDSYNGTISTTSGVREFSYTKSKQFPTPQSYADHLIETNAVSKWGVAGAILLREEKVDVEELIESVKKVEKIAPAKKAKTWESIYVVKLKDGTVIATNKSKTDATKRATDEVKKRKVEVLIEQQKVLKVGSPIELTLKPIVERKKSKKKENVKTYLLFGWAAE
jgi:hypothetical protein